MILTEHSKLTQEQSAQIFKVIDDHAKSQLPSFHFGGKDPVESGGIELIKSLKSANASMSAIAGYDSILKDSKVDGLIRIEAELNVALHKISMQSDPDKAKKMAINTTASTLRDLGSLKPFENLNLSSSKIIANQIASYAGVSFEWSQDDKELTMAVEVAVRNIKTESLTNTLNQIAQPLDIIRQPEINNMDFSEPAPNEPKPSPAPSRSMGM